MLQCWEGSEVAGLSEGVDDTWLFEELLLFIEKPRRVQQGKGPHAVALGGGEGAVFSEGVDHTW